MVPESAVQGRGAPRGTTRFMTARAGAAPSINWAQKGQACHLGTRALALSSLAASIRNFKPISNEPFLHTA